jgi:hypothetical protein
MTPKEKAEQLVHRMMYKIQWQKEKYHTLMEAKECALIAVDEILDAIEQIFETFEERKYWQEVKKEIEKL